MRGDEWNRLVGEPSALEVDAALAEVRLRAVPIARRTERHRRAISLLGLVLVAGAGMTAGRFTAAPGGVGLRTARAVGAPELVDAPSGYAPVSAPIQRWHVSTWDEMDGVRWNEAESWVEGPEGTSFRLSGSSLEVSYDARLSPRTWADSTNLYLSNSVVRQLGRLPDGFQASARRYTSHHLTVRRGHAAVFYPFGSRGEILTTVRIDGPFAPAPPVPVTWKQADTIGYRYAWERIDAQSARRAGVRFAMRNAGALSVQPRYTPPPPSLRFTLAGRAPSAVVEAEEGGNGRHFLLPGIADSMRVTYTAQLTGHLGDLCVFLQASLNTPRQRAVSGTACFSEARPREPVEFRLNDGRKITVQRVRP